MVAVCSVHDGKSAVELQDVVAGAAAEAAAAEASAALTPRHPCVACAGAVTSACSVEAVIGGISNNRTAVLVYLLSFDTLIALLNSYNDIIVSAAVLSADGETMVSVGAVISR